MGRESGTFGLAFYTSQYATVTTRRPQLVLTYS
jgi:hypothetical protein